MGDIWTIEWWLSEAFINFIFSEHGIALFTSIITAGFYMGLADLIVQITYERRQYGEDWTFESLRTLRSLVMGLIMGFISYFWYLLLDSIFTSDRSYIILIKIFADQLVGGSVFSTLYIFGMGAMEGFSFEDNYAEWELKFPEIYKMDWMYWPLAQIINFVLIGDGFRMVYINTITFVWNLYLSYVKHR